jgi:transposase InsO family protein
LDALLRRNTRKKPGNPSDNAKAESFMKTLKTEEVDGRSFKDIEDARRSIAVFIDISLANVLVARRGRSSNMSGLAM